MVTTAYMQDSLQQIERKTQSLIFFNGICFLPFFFPFFFSCSNSRSCSFVVDFLITQRTRMYVMKQTELFCSCLPESVLFAQHFCESKPPSGIHKRNNQSCLSFILSQYATANIFYFIFLPKLLSNIRIYYCVFTFLACLSSTSTLQPCKVFNAM